MGWLIVFTFFLNIKNFMLFLLSGILTEHQNFGYVAPDSVGCITGEQPQANNSQEIARPFQNRSISFAVGTKYKFFPFLFVSPLFCSILFNCPLLFSFLLSLVLSLGLYLIFFLSRSLYHSFCILLWNSFPLFFSLYLFLFLYVSSVLNLSPPLRLFIFGGIFNSHFRLSLAFSVFVSFLMSLPYIFSLSLSLSLSVSLSLLLFTYLFFDFYTPSYYSYNRYVWLCLISLISTEYLPLSWFLLISKTNHSWKERMN